MRLIRYDVLRLPCGRYKVFAWGTPNWHSFTKLRGPSLTHVAVPGQRRTGFQFHDDAFAFLDDFLHDITRKNKFERLVLPPKNGKFWSTELEPVVNRQGVEIGKTNRQLMRPHHEETT